MRDGQTLNISCVILIIWRSKQKNKNIRSRKKNCVCNHLIGPRERKRRKIGEQNAKIRLDCIIILVSKGRLMHVTLSLRTDTETNKTKSEQRIKLSTYLLMPFGARIFTFSLFSESHNRFSCSFRKRFYSPSTRRTTNDETFTNDNRFIIVGTWCKMHSMWQ